MSERRYLVAVTEPETRRPYQPEKTTTVTVWASSEYAAGRDARREVGAGGNAQVDVTPL